MHVDVHDQGLAVVGVLSLAFVLFLDAVNLRFDEGRDAWLVPALALGPGTLLTIVHRCWWRARLLRHRRSSPRSLIGTVLASIDPVVLRDVVRDRAGAALHPPGADHRSRNERHRRPAYPPRPFDHRPRRELGGTSDWVQLILPLSVIGPLVGAVVGFVAIWLIKTVRSVTPIGREYRALYGVGTVLAAYVAGEAVGGSGFLAVFVAGVVIAKTDYDLCDCFLEYGEITAEMLMLLAFILFGALLSSLVLNLCPSSGRIAFAVFVLVIARPLAISLVLKRTSVSRRARAFIGWFGPRGLSSLLFGLCCS